MCLLSHPSYIATQSVAHEKPVKLPSFTGKDSWKVWYNRFNTIAQLNNWDETTRLNQLLPRLQGDAGEFVYGELPQENTCSFRKLIEELENRFRMVETHKTLKVSSVREINCQEKQWKSMRRFSNACMIRHM